MDWKYELVANKWEDIRCTARIDRLASLGGMQRVNDDAAQK